MGEIDTGEWPEQRVGLFVDTQNLYYVARDQHGAHVDYDGLKSLAARGRRLAFAAAYVVERDGDDTAYGFVTRLSSLGFRVRRRTVRIHRADARGRALKEGDWDMDIAADMVRAWEGLDVLVLASGDGDFVPMLRLAQERGLRVEVVAFRESTAQALIDLADRYTNLPDVQGAFVTKRTPARVADD